MKRPEKKDYPSSIDFIRAQMEYYKARTEALDKELADLKEVIAAIESETKPDDWECEW